MYLNHFGLDAPPFKITPDPQLFYAGSERGLVLEALVYAISQGEGMVKVVGEVGSGKTMLCRMLPEKLPPHVEVLYLANPRLTPDTILHAIALEMRLPIAQQNAANHLQVMQALQQSLLEKHENNQQVVLLIEEAQGMPINTLEEIRLLSNLETTRNKLLQIVLFGQPELDANLAVQEIRQLRERITHSFYLSPLSRQALTEYLDFRMRAVGYRGPSVFAKNALKHLHKYAQGLLRRANILADKALLAAFSDGSHQVLAKHVQLAAQDSGFKRKNKGLAWQLSAAMVLGLLAVGLTILYGLADFFPSPPAAAVVSAQKPVLLNTPNTVDTHSKSLNSPSTTLISTALPVISLEKPPLSLLEQRLLASRAWLQQTNREAYSIQLMQIEAGKNRLEGILRQPEMQTLLEQLYLLPDKQQVSRWRVFYGDFTSYQAAQAGAQQLPNSLQANQPFVRPLKNLHRNQQNVDWEHLQY